MPDISLIAQLRSITGKKVGRLRRQGIIPANVYGRQMESVPVQFDLRALRDVLSQAGGTTVIDLHVRTGDGEDGRTHPVLIERVSRHPASGQVLHVDLRQVDLNRPVRAAVPLMLVGEAPAVDRHGAVLVHPLDTIEVEALPRALPHAIEVDISGLEELDAQITVGDLHLPPGVTVDTDPGTLVVRAMASKLEQEVAAEEAEAAEAAEAAAPEAEAAPEGAAAETPAEGGQEAP